MRTVPGSEIVGSAELRRRVHKKKERKKERKKEVKNKKISHKKGKTAVAGFHTTEKNKNP